MWNYYKKTFLAVQFAALLVSWMVYRNTKPVLGPALLFMLSMQISAVFGAMWAHRLSKKTQACMSTRLN